MHRENDPRPDAGNGAGAALSSLVMPAADWLGTFVRTPGRLAEFFRYTVVSGSSLALDLAVFAGLVAFAVMSAPLAGAVSCMVGLVLHYLLSAGYVFDTKATGKSDRRLIGEYALTGAMGFAITAGSILLVVDIAGLPAWLGKAVGVGATFVSVYLVRAGFVFAPNPDRKLAAPEN